MSPAAFVDRKAANYSRMSLACSVGSVEMAEFFHRRYPRAAMEYLQAM